MEKKQNRSSDPIEAIEVALGILLDASRNAFQEAAHTLPFPRDQGFLVEQDTQTGDIFARALIADALIDAATNGFEKVTPIVDREIDYLIASRERSGAGGWKYFPNLPELPPDADDLAQVMQVFARFGRRDAIEQYCERPLEILLRQNSHPDGSFETWIVLPDEELQRRWIERAWGSGPDPEVMANLLYALAIYDRERFSTSIERGIAYIEKQQDPTGAWMSTWYHGPFYGTFVALRLLATCAPRSRAIPRAVDFLSNAQLDDPLSTALALLAFSAVGKRPRVAIALPDAIDAVPFIRMQRQNLTYASKTITAAFVLKAAIAWKKH